MIKAKIISCIDASLSFYEQYIQAKEFLEKEKTRTIVLDEETTKTQRNRMLKFVLEVEGKHIIALEYDRLDCIPFIPLSGTELEIKSPLIVDGVYLLSNKNTFPIKEIKKAVSDENTLKALEEYIQCNKNTKRETVYLDSDDPDIFE